MSTKKVTKCVVLPPVGTAGMNSAQHVESFMSANPVPFWQVAAAPCFGPLRTVFKHPAKCAAAKSQSSTGKAPKRYLRRWTIPYLSTSFLLLLVRPGAPSSFLLLVAWHLFLIASCYY